MKSILKEKQENSKLTKAEFASKNLISDSIFNDWVIKYQRQGQRFCNITNEIKKLDLIEVVDREPVPLMVREINKKFSI